MNVKGFVITTTIVLFGILALILIDNFIDGLGEHGDASSRSIEESKQKNVFLCEYTLTKIGEEKLDTIVYPENDYDVNNLKFWVENVWRNETFLGLHSYIEMKEEFQLILPNFHKSKCPECRNEYRFSLDKIPAREYVGFCPFYSGDEFKFESTPPDSLLIYVYTLPSDTPRVDSIICVKVKY